MAKYDWCTDEYLEKKKECFDACLSKEFLQDLQELVREHYDFDDDYRIGNWDFMDEDTVGVYRFVETLAEKHCVQELITFLDSLDWCEYDLAMDTMFVTYGRKFHLFTPKRRYRNLFKAKALHYKAWMRELRKK